MLLVMGSWTFYLFVSFAFTCYTSALSEATVNYHTKVFNNLKVKPGFHIIADDCNGSQTIAES